MIVKPSKSWLAGVREVASRYGRRLAAGTHSVYLVLIQYRPGQFGIYVGLTGLTPEERYRNHKTGYKASRAVKRYGVGLLKPYFAHLIQISYEAAKRIEVELAASLRRAGYSVRGGH